MYKKGLSKLKNNAVRWLQGVSLLLLGDGEDFVARPNYGCTNEHGDKSQRLWLSNKIWLTTRINVIQL